jgi:hypothetical protein
MYDSMSMRWIKIYFFDNRTKYYTLTKKKKESSITSFLISNGNLSQHTAVALLCSLKNFYQLQNGKPRKSPSLRKNLAQTHFSKSY